MRYLLLPTFLVAAACSDVGAQPTNESLPSPTTAEANQSYEERLTLAEEQLSISRESLIAIRSSLAACRREARQLARLDCYDLIEPVQNEESDPEIESTTPQEHQTLSDRGDWYVNIDENPIDDTVRVTAMLEANEGSSTFGQSITFIARCMSNRTEAYINWNDYVGDDSSSVYSEWKLVTVRIGDAQARTERWGVSTDKRATFAPSWAGNLLQEMMRSDRAIFRITPYGESPVTAIFDTTGMDLALSPLMETCGWSSE